jgi:hypothetical protein
MKSELVLSMEEWCKKCQSHDRDARESMLRLWCWRNDFMGGVDRDGIGKVSEYVLQECKTED